MGTLFNRFHFTVQRVRLSYQEGANQHLYRRNTLLLLPNIDNTEIQSGDSNLIKRPDDRNFVSVSLKLPNMKVLVILAALLCIAAAMPGKVDGEG